MTSIETTDTETILGIYSAFRHVGDLAIHEVAAKPATTVANAG